MDNNRIYNCGYKPSSSPSTPSSSPPASTTAPTSSPASSTPPHPVATPPTAAKFEDVAFQIASRTSPHLRRFIKPVGSINSMSDFISNLPGNLIEQILVYLTLKEAARTSVLSKRWRYEGLSDKFLSCPVPKLLLLAGTDRLDRSLTIGQMQGKFQMVVVRHTGHAIQEDVPDEFATLIVNFISRNRIGPHGIEIPGLRRPSQPQP